jgi:hypothetical protein
MKPSRDAKGSSYAKSAIALSRTRIVYVGIAVLRQDQWLPEIDVAEKTWRKVDPI